MNTPDENTPDMNPINPGQDAPVPPSEEAPASSDQNLPEGQTLPEGQEPAPEEKPPAQKKKNTGNIVALVVALVIIAAIVWLVLGAFGLIPSPIDWSFLGLGAKSSSSPRPQAARAEAGRPPRRTRTTRTMPACRNWPPR